MTVVQFRRIEGKRQADPILGSPQIPPDAQADIVRLRVGYLRLWSVNPPLARFVLDFLLSLLARHRCLPPP